MLVLELNATKFGPFKKIVLRLFQFYHFTLLHLVKGYNTKLLTREKLIIIGSSEKVTVHLKIYNLFRVVIMLGWVD